MTQQKTPLRARKGVRQTKARGIGTGVIINAGGLILMAAHVVDSAGTIEAMLKNERKRRARVITSISIADLALIPLGDSSKIDIGAQVFVIGTPYDLEHTLTVGYLSGRRTTENSPFGDIEFLQTDTVINKGNSGVPMFSRQGELIGIVSHVKSQSGGSEGLRFAAGQDRRLS